MPQGSVENLGHFFIAFSPCVRTCFGQRSGLVGAFKNVVHLLTR